MKMVCGFLFSPTHVLLVRKTHPSWQVGLLNGVGGKMENKETPIEAMRREFQEEAGFAKPLDWNIFATEYEETQKALIYFFKAECEVPIAVPRHNDTGEPLEWLPLQTIHDMRDKIGNLSWLIPLALDPRRLLKVDVIARGDIREKPTW